MPPAAPDPPAGESLTETAADWFALMRGADAERHPRRVRSMARGAS
ncbi:MAG: hypothetical protein WDN24_03745 [Sphingomonas sp.]